MIEKFFEDELRYLYESGREFSKAHPDRARFLNIDAVGDRDPYVERLFEGFAFLAARIREKLDYSFPELTEGLINLLWPGFQQDIPSLCTVEFKPRRGHLHETRILPKGSELLTNAVGPEAVVCKFITTQDVKLNPLSLHSIEKKVDTKNRGILTLNFLIDNGVKMQNLQVDPLRLYIHGETPTALALHELFINHILKAEVKIDNGKAAFEIERSKAITPG